MELQNSFIVPADIDTAWKTLLDVESIAPCMPGATLTSFTGEEFTASVKVKLGPVTQNFNGEGRFTTRDETTHTAIIEASGKEIRGGGSASAIITAVLVSEGPNSTRADVTTDLTITGKVAQFGKGVIADVSKKLIDQFANNLQAVIAARSAAESAAPGEVVAAPVIQAADSIDLLGSAGAPVLKRLVPVVIGIVVVVGVIWWLIAK
jgi:carbon monoxide dehydrogenase subunit G